MGVKKTIIRNVFSNWAGLAVNMVVGFFLMRFLVQSLGDTTYGLWILIGSMTGYFGLLGLGIRGSVGRYIAHYRAKDDQDNINTTLNTTLVILSLAAVLVLVATAVLVVVFPLIFPKIPSSQIATVRWALAIVGLNLALNFPLSTFDGVLWAFQRFDILNAIDIPVTLLRAGATVWLIRQGGGLIALAVITLTCALIANALKIVFSFREDRDLKLRLSLATRHNGRLLFGFGIWNFIISIGSHIIKYTDIAIISGFLGPALATPYAIARRLTQYAASLGVAATGVLTPVATAMDARAEIERQKRFWIQGTRFCLVFALFFLTGAIFLGKDLIAMWMGSKYVSSYPILVILAVGTALDMSIGMSATILRGMAKHRYAAWLRIFEAGANIVLSITLVRHYGLIGVALGTMIPKTVTNGLVYPLILCRVLKISLAKFMSQTVLRATLCSIPVILLGYLLGMHSTRNLLVWGLKAASLGIGFGLVFWLVALSMQQRQQVLEYLRSRMGRHNIG